MAWVPRTASISNHVFEVYESLNLNRPTNGNLPVQICTDIIRCIAQDAQNSRSASFRIIIDALDECEKATQLLKSLNEATKTCNNVFFVFSSRFNVQIPKYLAGATQVHITPERTSEDMMFFIHNDISSRDETLPGSNPSELEEKLSGLLKEKANGM